MLSAVFASPELWEIITLSLKVSLTATAAAALLGLPLGDAAGGLAVSRPARRDRRSSTRCSVCRRR